ncbi:protein tyrosine kinase [Nocardia sp. NBC_01329]|uniref:protein tyrosine kinase n=1 Tax=Nocardia sp. NBC_01329 TaxID=2903594 RepID=UPI002E111B7A|nr:protein tyrosine kinase [Nocardia sp. NBC_01329]
MMELPDYLRLLRRYWAVLLAGVALGVGLAAYQVESTPTTYTANSTLYISMATGTSVADSYQGGLAAQQRVRSYLELITSDHVVDRVIGQLGLNLDREELRAAITADTPPATSLIRVSVTDEDAETSRVLTDQVVAQFRALVDELETIEVTAAPAARVAVVDAAQAPAEAGGPGGSRLYAVGALAGLLLGAVVAYLLDRLNRRVRDGAELAALGQPVLGTVALGTDREPADLRALRARLPEAGRLVVTVLDGRSEPALVLGAASMLGATGAEVLVIDANTSGHGVSTLLPESLLQLPAPNGEWPVRDPNPSQELVTAASGRTSAVVRGEIFDPPTVKLDLRTAPAAPLDDLPAAAPAVPAKTGARAADGLAAVLREDIHIDEAFVLWPERSVVVLALGKADDRTQDLLASTRFETLLSDVAKRFDRVVVDIAPADAAAVAPGATGTAGVVRLGSARRDRIESALTGLTAAGAKVSGVVAVTPRRTWWRRS